jgi:hypothetical protein
MRETIRIKTRIPIFVVVVVGSSCIPTATAATTVATIIATCDDDVTKFLNPIFVHLVDDRSVVRTRRDDATCAVCVCRSSFCARRRMHIKIVSNVFMTDDVRNFSYEDDERGYRRKIKTRKNRPSLSAEEVDFGHLQHEHRAQLSDTKEHSNNNDKRQMTTRRHDDTTPTNDRRNDERLTERRAHLVRVVNCAHIAAAIAVVVIYATTKATIATIHQRIARETNRNWNIERRTAGVMLLVFGRRVNVGERQRSHKLR